MVNVASPNDMPNALQMRLLGAFLVLFSIIEFGVGGAVYGFLRNVSFGAWWCAIFTFISGILGLSSKNRNIIIAACACSVIGIIMTLVGSSVDGAANAMFQAETGCFNTKTGAYSGSNDGKIAAAYCAGWFGSAYSDLSAWQCVCTDQQVCYHYTLVSGNDCGGILTTYRSNLAASTAISSILCIMIFIFSIFTCCTLCGGQGGAAQFTYNPAASTAYNPAASTAATAGSVPPKSVYINDEGVDDQAL